MQARVQDIISMIESYFPLRLAESWDNPGLQLDPAVNRLTGCL